MALFSTATFRTIGAAATTQNLFSIWNGGSNRIVHVKRLVMQMDATVVLTAVMPIIKTSRVSSAPGAGITMTKVPWDTADTASHADIVCKGEVSSDGGSRTALTGTPGDVLWQQYGMRMHTVVGQVLGIDNNVVSSISENTPVVLRANQGLMVHIVAAAGASNPATNHYFIMCAWEEETP